MIRCRENRNDITQSVEIDLIKVDDQSRQHLEHEINECLKNIDKKYQHIFRFEPGNKFVYETEVLTPKVNKNRINILMVLGNPAVHSVAERMFFSYEKTGVKGKWREHRFWRALRDCGILKFDGDLGKPTPENIDKINDYKRHCLLNGDYISDFNIFLLPYFSFPTPASGTYNGVNGIREIVGKEIFKVMREFEYQRFKGIILGNDINSVICFQKTNVLKEIKQRTKCEQVKSILNDPHYPVYKLDDALKYVTLYYAGSTKSILTDEGKKILRSVVADIKAKNKIG